MSGILRRSGSRFATPSPSSQVAIPGNSTQFCGRVWRFLLSWTRPLIGMAVDGLVAARIALALWGGTLEHNLPGALAAAHCV